MQGWIPFTPGPLAVVLVLGLCFGSFLNVVIYRLPRDLSLVRPRSRCGSCQRQISWFENVPVLSWLLLRGRCRTCGARISPRYPTVELLGAGLTATAAFAARTPLESVAALFFLLALLAVFFIDLEHRIIPDEISLGGTVLGLGLSFWRIGFGPALIGAAVGAVALYSIGWIYQRIRGRPGMGLGDVKLAAMLGAFLGLPGLVLTVLFASLLGSVVGVGLILLRRAQVATALPFGSFLAPAAMVALVWGQDLWRWYLGLFPHAR